MTLEASVRDRRAAAVIDLWGEVTAAGTTALLAASDLNTTKTTGGSGPTNYVQRALSLNGTPANLNTAAGDVLVFTATKAASAANLVGLVVAVEFTFEG